METAREAWIHGGRNHLCLDPLVDSGAANFSAPPFLQ
jgi:hypothetical protein